LRKEHFVNNIGRTTLAFLAGLGVGAAIALLSAPRSGEETREWIADKAERKFKMLRRSGRRSIRQLHNTVTKGEEKFTEILKDGKEALALVATKLM
jgi:gas vesicle protein